MKKFLCGLVTLVLLLGSTGLAMAGPGGPSGPGGPGSPEGLLPLVLTLDLTNAQKHDVALIFKKYQDRFRQDLGPMHEAMRDLGDVMRKDPGNEQLVRQACRKVGAAIEATTVLRGKMLAEVKAVLTPAQLKQLDETLPPPPPPASKKHREPPFHVLVNEWINAHAGQGK